MIDMSLLEEDNDSASNDAFSEQQNSENNSKENEGVTPAKKVVKGKAQKVTPQPVKVAKAAAPKPAEEVGKKAAPKKASVKKAEAIEPTPVKVESAAPGKKVAAKKQSEVAIQPEALKKATPAKKSSLKAGANLENAGVNAEAEPLKKAAVKKSLATKTETSDKAESIKKAAPVKKTAAAKKAVPAPQNEETQAVPVTDQSTAEEKLVDEQQPLPGKQGNIVTEMVAEQQPEASDNTEAISGITAEQPLFEAEPAPEVTEAVSNEIPAEEQSDADNDATDLTGVTEPAMPVSGASAETEQGVLDSESEVDQEKVSVPTENTAEEPKTSKLKKVTFQLKFSTVVGEALYVSGNHPLLGNNNHDEAFPLNYLNENYWVGTLQIPEEAPITGDISYNYILKNVDGTFSVEWGCDKLIRAGEFDKTEVLLIDSWNASSLIENTYYTEPFQEVLLKENFTDIEANAPENVTHIFRAKAPLLPKGQALCIIGSIEELGKWNTEKPLLLSRKPGEVWHSVSLDLSNANFPFIYKYGVYDVNADQFIQYEGGENRIMYDGNSPSKLTVVSDGFAQIPNTGYKGAGVAIPVFSLRTERGFGVGEFTDLKLLVDWAKQVGLKLIQLLPVNDTTATHTYTDSYPYAAISAFALHPLYLHIPAIVNKDNKEFLDALQGKQAELNSKAEVDYVEVMRNKWDLIKQIYPSQKEKIFNSPDFKSFFKENAHWLIPYAAFSYFREQNKTSDFNQWSSNQTFDAQHINELAGYPLEADNEISVYYYIQYHLHLQLIDATNYAHENGIIVKGDIPIGIYRNSCDAWQQPELYNMNMQAGAPPDDFAVKGQNWGFPTYNWQKMREDGFQWWKKRFKQMSYYFDAFRIDHILGFFRIWSIPMDAVEGIMGHFVPAMPIHINEIAGRNVHFDYQRFCKPFINNSVLADVFGSDAEWVKNDFVQEIGNGSFEMKPEFDTQRKVEAYFATQEVNEQNTKLKEGLYDLISNVLLFEADGTEGEQFHFRISMTETTSFKYLDGHTQHHLKELYVNYYYRRQDYFWMKEAMLKLPELKRSTNMLICGEDLGMVPECVPGVMKELAILSLEIQRMPKNPARPFFHPNDAPYLSVVTPSTHDMSTIRGWWEEDRAVTQQFYNSELGQWGTAPYFCEPWVNKIILLQHLYSPAMWSIFQLQDILGISASLRRENPHEERINVPANPKHYWRYRMHLNLETLINETEFTTELRQYIQESGR